MQPMIEAATNRMRTRSWSFVSTSIPNREAIRAVTLCCPSNRMRFPAEGVPSQSLTVEVLQAIR